MRVLVIHNQYQQRTGGEASVAEAEKQVLLNAGHQVVEYAGDNAEISDYGLWQKATLAARTVWAWDSFREIKKLIEKQKPDIAHFHNTFPLISPAAYYACSDAGVPVVQTLHNYRLLCPAATLMRDGHVCEDCLGKKFPWPGIIHACYRDSYAGSTVVAVMLGVHNLLGTWAAKGDVFIALTEFARRKFVEGGLPAKKIVVKPNFIHPDPWNQQSSIGSRKSAGKPFALFAGRLSPEKGLGTLIAAWKRLNGRVPLHIVGDGPPMPELKALVNGSRAISFHGAVPRDRVLEYLRGTRFLVFPSECYEAFGMTIAEAFACGVPVIASRLGSMAEIVEDGKTGLHFNPGDPEDLAERVEWAWTHPAEMAEMGCNARAEYQAKYSAEGNYQMLMDIYARAMLNSQAARAGLGINSQATGDENPLWVKDER